MEKLKSLSMSKCVLLLWLWVFPFSVFAQNLSISGVVTDNKGEPLIGVSVVIKGSTNGTVSDVDGRFTLQDVPSQATLEVSYIGMNTREIPVNGKSQFTIRLEEDVVALDELVVVGYGSVGRRDLTAAVSTVSSKDFLQGASNNPLQMIDGMVAGVTISNYAASDPNRDPMESFQVRGATTFSSGSAPLVVIDGMPGGDLRQLANQDIENITVLKDGSAAAIYGSRAANGVVIVTTKSGKSGRSSISYDTYFEHDMVYKKPNLLSPAEFLEHKIDSDLGARTDWYDEIVRKNNFGQSHHIAIGGGTEKGLYRLSANFKEKEGIDLASERREYGVRASFVHKTLEDLLEVSGNISYRVTDEAYSSYGTFAQAVKLNPTLPVMDPENPRIYNYLYGYDTYNPVAELLDKEDGGKNEYSMVDFTTKLNLLSNLNTELKLARQGRDLKKYLWRPSTHKESIDNSRRGRARLTSEKWTDLTLEWLVNYYRTIGSHNIKLMAGYSYQEFNFESFLAENMDFPSDAFKYNKLSYGTWNLKEGRLGMDSKKEKEKNVAFFGRLNYSYEDTYLLTASLRREGNSKFGVDQKWGLFPALSLAWRLSKLSMLGNIEMIDDLKIRASYGVTGRSGFPRYISQSIYSGFGKYLNDEGRWVQVYGPGNNPNPDLHWEKQISYNYGVDYSLFGGRLSGSVDYFIRKGKDLIAEYDVPVPPFLHGNMYANVISTNTNGLELNLDLKVLKTKDLEYTTNIICSYAKTKAADFSSEKFKGQDREVSWLPSPGNPGYAQRLGQGLEIGSFFGGKYAGVDEQGEILIWEKGVVDGEKKRASQKNSDDIVYIGHGMPRWELSWGNTFRFKNIDFSLYFKGKFDYQVLNVYQMYYGLQKQPNVNLLKDAFDRNAHIKGEKQIVDYFLESGNYLKLDNITLGYTPKLHTKYLSQLRLYVTAKNLFTLTKYSGIDPAGVHITGLTPGVGSLDLYPSTTNVSVGLQISY